MLAPGIEAQRGPDVYAHRPRVCCGEVRRGRAKPRRPGRWGRAIWIRSSGPRKRAWERETEEGGMARVQFRARSTKAAVRPLGGGGKGGRGDARIAAHGREAMRCGACVAGA